MEIVQPTRYTFKYEYHKDKLKLSHKLAEIGCIRLYLPDVLEIIVAHYEGTYASVVLGDCIDELSRYKLWGVKPEVSDGPDIDSYHLVKKLRKKDRATIHIGVNKRITPYHGILSQPYSDIINSDPPCGHCQWLISYSGLHDKNIVKSLLDSHLSIMELVISHDVRRCTTLVFVSDIDGDTDLRCANMNINGVEPLLARTEPWYDSALIIRDIAKYDNNPLYAPKEVREYFHNCKI